MFAAVITAGALNFTGALTAGGNACLVEAITSMPGYDIEATLGVERLNRWHWLATCQVHDETGAHHTARFDIRKQRRPDGSWLVSVRKRGEAPIWEPGSIRARSGTAELRSTGH